MQKRTNPLELKLETKQPPFLFEEAVEPDAAPVADPVEEVFDAPAVEEAVPETVSEAVTEPVEQENAPVVEPTVEKKPVKKKASKPKEKPAAEKKQEAPKKTPTPSVIEEDVRRSPLMNGDMRWQRVVLPGESEPAASPTPAAEPVAPTPKAATFFKPIVEEPEQVEEIYEETPEAVFAQEAFAEEVCEEQTEPTTQDYIDDEEEALTLEDYALSVRFALRGRITRGTKLTKISRDVCRLAQLMHPGQSLSTIVENALLTRIYLENRDAFDAMAEMLEKKGGHIKC